MTNTEKIKSLKRLFEDRNDLIREIMRQNIEIRRITIDVEKDHQSLMATLTAITAMQSTETHE